MTMANTVTFDPVAMRQVADDIDHRGRLLRDVGDQLWSALDAYTSSGSEFVVSTPAHGHHADEYGQLMQQLAASVDDLAEAAEEADRQGVDLARLRDHLAPVGAASTLKGRHDVAMRLLRASVHGGRDVRAAAHRLRLDRRYGTRPMPSIDAIRREVPGGQRMKRPEVRRHQLQRYRQLKRQRSSLARTREAARTGLRENTRLTRWGRRVDDFMTTTRTGSVLRYGGKALGVTGTVLGTYDTVDAIVDGDTGRAMTNGLSTVGGVMMVTGNPVVMGAGALLVAGVAVYENWDTITDWGSSAVDTVGDGLSKARDLGESVVNGAADFIGGLF